LVGSYSLNGKNPITVVLPKKLYMYHNLMFKMSITTTISQLVWGTGSLSLSTGGATTLRVASFSYGTTNENEKYPYTRIVTKEYKGEK
jgi:hypothetical protein